MQTNPTPTQSAPVPTRRARWAIVALIALLMLPNLVWLAVGHGTETWAAGLLLSSLLLLMFFALLGNVPWLACLLLAPFAALAPLEAFYVGSYQGPSTAEILATLVATNPREAYEFLGLALIPILLCVAAGFLLALLAAWWNWRSRNAWRHRSRAWAVTAAITLPIAVLGVAFANSSGNLHSREQDTAESVVAMGDPIANGYPFGLIARIAEYHSEWKQMRESAAALGRFRFNAHRADAPRTNGNSSDGNSSVASAHPRQVYVLVIGESSRRDHWQLFGYPRPTNPELGKVSNLVPIPDFVTSWSASILAIPLIITRKPASDRHYAWHEASILRAMNEAGFDTYWISNQLAIGKYDSPVSIFAYEAKHVEFLNHASFQDAGSYDEVLLQPLRDALQDSHRDLFIVLHMMGSHARYDYRYPPAFKRFTPVQSDPGDSASRIQRDDNSYDNTIVYTDHVLARVIDILRHSDATTALFYESDHGEDLPTPTCNLSGHGHTTRFDFQIPALFWYSDAYATQFPARVAALRANANQHIASRDTFESLIDMAGVDYPGHDRRLSLFSPDWRYRPRTVIGWTPVDFDDASFGKRCEVIMPRTDAGARQTAAIAVHRQHPPKHI
jgi:glucan phosphoethanolaminetransferase (alkaline phosphatase superfamily)